MTNGDIARIFERIALILELRGDENPFRIRAYERAAQNIENLSMHLSDVYRDGGIKELKKIPGIGVDLALKIEELVTTGKLAYMKEVENKVPIGLLKLLEIESLGPKKTKFLWQKYKVKDMDDLVALMHSGKLLKEKGWGEKSIANVLAGVERHGRSSGRVLLPVALETAEELVSALQKSKLCDRIEIAGSLRRRRETVGDIDILVTSKKPEKVLDFFTTLPQIENVIARGPTKASVHLLSGLQADLRVLEPDVFGAALHYFTGSKDHNVQIRKIGISKGVTISEYGVFKGTAKAKGKLVAAKTEEDVFRTVGLAYIPPELREDRGEILAAASGKLPNLIEEKDLKGDLHMHSTFSDGSASIEAMAEAAKERGHEYIAITDHASSMGMVKGLKTTNIKEFLKSIERARKKVPGIQILAGTEVDIGPDGTLYLDDDILSQLDIVVASVHQYFKQSREEATKRLVKVLKNPYVTILGHPTGRLLGKRDGIDVDMEVVLQTALQTGTWIELNASPDRLDLSDVYLKRAKELGVSIVIDSDSHSIRGFNYRFGIMTARRGWIEKEDVINALPWKKFEKELAKRKKATP